MAAEVVKPNADEPTKTVEEEEVEDAEVEEEGSEEEVEEEAEPEKPTEEPSSEAKPVDVLSEKLRLVEQENAFLKGRQIEAERRREVPVVEEEEEDDLPSEETLDAALRGQNPAGALRTILKGVRDSAERRAEKKSSATVSASSAATRLETQDHALAEKHYPEIKTSKDFAEVRDQILEAMTRRNGGKYLKGDIVTATAAAYGELLNAGILQPRKKANGNGNGREIVRTEVKRQNNAEGARPATAGRKAPFEGFSLKERAAAEKNCKEFKITPEQWRKSYDEYQKEISGE